MVKVVADVPILWVTVPCEVGAVKVDTVQAEATEAHSCMMRRSKPVDAPFATVRIAVPGAEPPRPSLSGGFFRESYES